MFLFSVSFYLLLLHVTAAIDPWDLPVFPPEMASRTEDIPDEEQVSKRYQIPRHVWISVKETPLIVPTHLTNMMSREKPFNWSFHLVNNEQATEFMEMHFANTSTLWAFHQLSSYIGPAIADLWRYCILYVKGGFYMDHDVIWPSHLDDLIASPATQIVVAKEQNAYKNICYNDTSSLNDRSLARYYNVSLPTIKSIMEGRVIVNWALSSAPKHIFLYKAIENSVDVDEKKKSRKRSDSLDEVLKEHPQIADLITGENSGSVIPSDDVVLHHNRTNSAKEMVGLATTSPSLQTMESKTSPKHATAVALSDTAKALEGKISLVRCFCFNT